MSKRRVLVFDELLTRVHYLKEHFVKAISILSNEHTVLLMENESIDLPNIRPKAAWKLVADSLVPVHLKDEA